MALDFSRARPLLQSGDLAALFREELGWEPSRQKLTLAVGITDYSFTAFAKKKGFTCWYLKALKDASYEMEKSGLMLQTFEYSSTKSILDEIDTVLAEHYGFTMEELDFIINYDIKYRLGREAEDVEE